MKQNWLILLILFIGVALRFLVSFRGFTGDFLVFLQDREVLLQHGSIYASISGYNYGPGWFLILTPISFFSTIFNNYVEAFRLCLIGVLSASDVGIFFILLKKFGKTPAILFFLNPVSIIITGYHNQFDTIALFLGMLSIFSFGDDLNKVTFKKGFLGIFFLSLSLLVKHDFIFFPLWLGFKEKKWWKKAVYTLIPVAIFLVSFLPWWNVSSNNIIHNVFLYRGSGNAPLWNLLIPSILKPFISSFIFFIVIMVLGGFVFRNRPLFPSFLFYTGILLIGSSAIADTYFVIIIPLIVVYFNYIYLYLVLLVTTFLFFNIDELHFSSTHNDNAPLEFYYTAMVIVLVLGFVYMVKKELWGRVQKDSA